ncbi:SRPBCC domain-containing protein [Pseudooceanicola sp. LIPI14-2-Ac024]|uniref:SRPBCC domain-containing protein n=1 Tax=Pseudooceanicola sp. LIPI14-2-Ac024 TaxID=3344875 RepID=UPI0035D12022
MSVPHIARRHIAASPAACFAAWADAEAVAVWLPPHGMRGRIERFDLREGGGFRLILTYVDGPNPDAKSTADSDVAEGRFVTVDAPHTIAFDSTFEGDDEDYAGTMRMTWRFDPVPDGGTVAEVTAENVPRGIDRVVHETAIGMSLENLERYLQDTGQRAGAAQEGTRE